MADHGDQIVTRPSAAEIILRADDSKNLINHDSQSLFFSKTTYMMNKKPTNPKLQSIKRRSVDPAGFEGQNVLENVISDKNMLD